MTLGNAPRLEDIPKQPLRVRCGAPGCGHKWIAAYIPMEMDRLAKILKRACCPACGEAKKICIDQTPKKEK